MCRIAAQWLALLQKKGSQIQAWGLFIVEFVCSPHVYGGFSRCSAFSAITNMYNFQSSRIDPTQWPWSRDSSQ